MPKPDARRRVWILGLAAVVLVLVVLGVWYLLRPKGQPQRAPGLSRADAVRLVEEKNVGLGSLENLPNDNDNDGSRSLKAFTEIAEALPDEPLGYRNLAITRLILLSKLDPNQTDAGAIQTAYDNAADAIQRLREVEGDTAVVHLLLADLAKQPVDKKLSSDEKRVVAEYARAAKLRPDDFVIWSELHLAAQHSSDEQLQQQAREALQRAYELRPDNLSILLDWMLTQAEQHDPDIVKTLKAAKDTLKPFAPAVRRLNVDLEQLINEAIAAAQTGGDQNWPIVLARVRVINNVIKPEFAQHVDLARRSRHILEYVIDDFSPAFYQRAHLPTPEAPPAIPVKFVRAAEGRVPQGVDGTSVGSPLPELGDARDVLLADFNLDSWLDVIVLRTARLEVYGFDPADKQWHVLAATDVPDGMERIAAADLDRDHQEMSAHGVDQPQPQNAPPAPREKAANGEGQRPPRPGLGGCLNADVDLVVSGTGGVRLYKNQLHQDSHTRSLDPMPQQDPFEGLKNVRAVGIADLEGDGDLDLAVSSDAGITLWANLENGTFTDITDRSALPPYQPATDILPVDVNRDVSIDLLLTGPAFERAGDLENIRHGRFRWHPFEKPPHEPEASATAQDLAGASAFALIDADGNASWDIVAAGKTGIRLVETQMRRNGLLSFLKTERISESPATDVRTWDFDNDGYQDLLALTPFPSPTGRGERGEGITVYRGLPNGRFESVDDLFEPAPERVTAADVGDLDDDGDLDVALVEGGRLRWYVNDGGNANQWIDLALRAESDPQQISQRCNMHGIGSLIELKTGTKYQAQVARRQSTHFGLGSSPDGTRQERADVIRVLWTNGIPQNVIQPDAEQAVCQKQRLLKGSCPYLYTWTGDRFEFFTDLLWSAPIGLQWAEGVLAPTREWEYLKIPGEKLVPRNGEYQLQVTEELWEVAYLDSAELLAVDHPADVDIYSNEKVGPGRIAEFQIRTVRTPRHPVAARDARGRDVLPQIAERDDVYLKPFDRRLKQGLTEKHFVELDLGPLDHPQRIILFLTGWIFPTDTSLNIAISQNPDLEPPAPPSLWVPDGKGGWREAIPYTGFPGGKTKTIAIPIPPDAFPQGDYRLRLVTSMELYWDQIFFTVDEQSAKLRVTPAPLISADLHERGFSQRIEHPGHGPESYDYNTVSTQPRWPPIDGAFTRFGDVSELMRTTDDRLVIMGAGDEMTLRFHVPDPPPDGWTRDFILHNVGWDKDADLNTVTGQTVEPLPFVEMSQYPYAPNENPPQTQTYQQYLREYQTRRQNRFAFWKQIERIRRRPSSTPTDSGARVEN